MGPVEMARRLGEGLLSFPVTHFGADGAFAEGPYRDHCAWMLEHELSGLFAAGGTGEFFSLTPDEVIAVARAAVAERKAGVPVLAGCGYGTAIATEIARGAEAAGVDGLLLLPPYLVNSTQQGLAAHIEAVCRSTGLGVIVYNRDNAVVDAETLAGLCDRNPNLVGYKDGVGDIELMTQIRLRLGDRLTYIGGLPTAETFAVPYLTMGVTTYSSAIFNFLPEWALAFHRVAHWLFVGELYFLARLVNHLSRWLTAIDIHPGAKIGKNFFIDHGFTVIGETAEIGDNVTIYQCVTLGGTNPTNGIGGKRHPTLRDNVIIGSGAQVIGPITVGERARVGANAVVTDDVPEGATMIGLKARSTLVPAETWLREFIPYGTPCDEPCESEGNSRIEALERELAAMRAELAELCAAGKTVAPARKSGTDG